MDDFPFPQVGYVNFLEYNPKLFHFCEGNLPRGGAGRTSSLLHSSRSAPGGSNKNGGPGFAGYFCGATQLKMWKIETDM